MRIAINASILDDRPTGMGIYAVNVVRELAARLAPGDRLTVFTGCPAALAGIDMEIAPLSPLVQPSHGKAGGVWRFAWTQLGLPLAALRRRYDVLYHLTHHGVPYRLPGLPQVLTIQTDVEVAFEFPDQHRLQHYYFAHVVPRLIAASEAVITTSEYARQALARVYRVPADRLHFAYNAFDRDTFRPERAADDAAVLADYGVADAPYVLAVGATYPHKNTATLLAALAELAADGAPAPRLLIAGYRPGYLEPLLAGLAPALRHRVTAVPYVPQARLPALYRGALCLAFPSFHESFGIPCVEAMGTGCPVVTARASSLPEVCGDAALYVEPTDATGLAAAIRRIAAEPALAARLRGAGLARAAGFSWRATADTVYDVLRAVAGRRRESRERSGT